jgi:serine phosphatase RsbU (regulator of sigma subunit)
MESASTSARLGPGEEVQRLHRRLQELYRQGKNERELARRVQARGLPASLPEWPGLRFGVHHRPSGQPGGDFFGLFRLDPRRAGFFVAHVVGHDTTAGLLAILVQQHIHREPAGLLEPERLLQSLNRVLLELELPEPTFVKMLCGWVDAADGALALSRAGPFRLLHCPADERPKPWPLTGNLLGIFASDFDVCRRQLAAGDRLLVADGSDPDEARAGRLLQAAQSHRVLPLQPWLDQLARELAVDSDPQDDFTLLGMER